MSYEFQETAKSQKITRYIGQKWDGHIRYTQISARAGGRESARNGRIGDGRVNIF
jgi:hypothetical protein